MSGEATAPPSATGSSGREAPARVDDSLFRVAFQNSPAMQTVTRLADRRIIEVNETFVRKLGYSREELLGRTAAELNFWVRPELEVGFRAELQARGFVRDMEVDVYTKAREIRSVLLSADVIPIHGEPHLVAAGVDITARKDAEARLLQRERQWRESEARFSTAFHASPLIMCVARPPDTTLVEVNDAFVRFVGLPRERVLGRTSAEIGLWARTEERERFYECLEREGRVRDFAGLMCVQGGQLRHLQISADLMEINGVRYLLKFAVDVTDQRRAEQVLQDAETRIRSLYETISAAAMVHDENRFIQVNSAAVRLFGAQRMEDLVGLHPGQVSPPVQPDGESSFSKAQRHMACALVEGRHRFEWTCRKFDGTDFPVEVTLTTLQLGGRRVMQAVVLDLTERKRAETELQNALAQERELRRLKSDFVSLVSHEFRTPLEIIMSSADNLQRYHDRLAKEKREQLLQTIHKSVRRMSGMMEEVLVLGRVESGSTEFLPEVFDVHAFSHRVCDEIQTATGHRCGVDLDLGGAPSVAVGDQNLLRHVLLNLLSNAVKYSPEGSRISLGLQCEGDDGIFRVADRGCGIPAADQPRLFQAFHRGGNVRQIPGTGLGLVIVKRCVELQGGEIRCHSVEGQGTTFIVTLPLFGKFPNQDPAI